MSHALAATAALLWQPFAEFAFLRRALVACVALAVTGGPLGTLLVLRRMSLVGDAMAHALLPGAAVGYLLAGLSLGAMSAGAFVAALLVALLAGAVARRTPQREDASFAAFYLIALALGVLLIARRGGGADLMHLLFGSVLAVDVDTLRLVVGVASVTLLLLALLWRPLVAGALDPQFLQTVAPGLWPRVHGVFLGLVVAQLVAGFQALGTLMAVGLLMLPATAARFWVRGLGATIALAAAFGIASAAAGLLISFHAELPSGPAIVLVAGAIYLVSLALGRHGGLRAASSATARRAAPWLAGTAVAALALLPRPAPAAEAAPAPLPVVASFSILADLVREIGGDAVTVTALVGPGGDAHVYEPTPAAVRAIAQAKLVVVNGLRFEGWIDRLVAASGYRGPVVVASDGIVPRLVYGQPDPHAWHDPRNVARYVANIRDALQRALPAQADAIGQRAQRYTQRLAALDARLRTKLATVPPERRRAVTSHDAFGYLADAYGLSFASAQGWTTAAEPSAAAVARLERQLKQQRPPALFLEQSTNPRLAERLARDTGTVLGGTLYADALTPPGGPADTLLKLLEHNLDTLVAAWTARPPATP